MTISKQENNSRKSYKSTKMQVFPDINEHLDAKNRSVIFLKMVMLGDEEHMIIANTGKLP
jgi:hypothetical protein